jgi:hypothetical protein
MNPTKITGPTNAIRLEGYVGNIKKVIYLIGEYHVKKYKCIEPNALTISQYISNFIETSTNLKKKYDIFIETPISHASEYDIRMTYDKAAHIYDIRDLRYYKSDKNIKNIRLHNIDPRLFINENWYDFKYDLYAYMDKNNYLDQNVINNIVNMCNINLSVYNIMYSNLFDTSKAGIVHGIVPGNKLQNQSKNKTKIVNKKDNKNKLKLSSNFQTISELNNYVTKNQEKLLEKLVTKITKEYTHREIQTIIQNKILAPYLKHYFDSEINDYLTIRDKFTSIKLYDENQLSFYNNKYNYFFNNKFEMFSDIKSELNEHWTEFISDSGVLLTDIYTIRRFLDKEYITNCILYGGLMHTRNIVYLLVKYFNFKITHIANKDHSIDDIHAGIGKAINNISDIGYYIYPSIFTQCIDIEGFPHNFE